MSYKKTSKVTKYDRVKTKPPLKEKPPIVPPHTRLGTGGKVRSKTQTSAINYPVIRMNTRRLQALACLKFLFMGTDPWGELFIKTILSELGIDDHILHYGDEDIFNYYSSLVTHQLEDENDETTTH
jgi:hypothetical protein